MMLDDDEEILWEPNGSIAFGKDSRDFKRGKFIVTNRRLEFEVKKKILFGLVDMGEESIWNIDIEDITDINARKRTLFGTRRLFIDCSGKIIVLHINEMNPESAKKKIKNLIRDSKKRSKDEEFEKELDLRKASKSEVVVNVGERNISKGKNKFKIPKECYACGEELYPDEVEWIGPGRFECPECGKKIRVLISGD